ncbi:HsdR family type I site-specific deoxyribonuclease [Mesomycoplasma ovipneumoniae]|uniref:HsdR family type I site-specific deoxyribonuclease n=1 Tax=Mesomycoplasma ovipneumoniae TaxID=29562 RepID=UPI00311CC386
MKNFKSEKEFEQAIVDRLTTQENGWLGFEDESGNKKGYRVILENVTEKVLIKNWKDILFGKNKDILNNVNLSDEEMEEVIQKIDNCPNFVESNILLTNEYISIKRSNPALDSEKIGQEVQLKIFSKKDIGIGPNVYQIARQVTFKTTKNDEMRADLMLLFNGIPLIHIELKNQSEKIESAITQIKNYAKNGLYKGIFKLVQIVVAMKPNEMLYLPNTNNIDNINKENFLKWTDKNNRPINDYLELVDKFFSIPMAHRMIGDYIIADNKEKNLKVLRSYQVHAVEEIIYNRLKRLLDDSNNLYKHQKGGYVWHSTGSGKTLTSFKLATLILEKEPSNIVIFVADRIELVTQTLKSFNNFNSSGKIDVIKAKSTEDLIKHLSTDSIRQKLIITSIHKQSRVTNENFSKKLNKITKKKKVFIFDEAHRTTFGDMYNSILKNMSNSVIFGFTGTPITEINAKNMASNGDAGLTTKDNFGPKLHKYTMQNAMEDKKVLGFSPQYSFMEHITSTMLDLVQDNKNKIKIFEYLSKFKESDKQIIDLEEKIFEKYATTHEKQYKEEVVKNILELWPNRSSSYFYSAILTVGKIESAIKYFEIFSKQIEEQKLNLKITALFDPSINSSVDSSNKSRGLDKKEDIEKILQQYNKDFRCSFDYSKHDEFKEDIQKRLKRNNLTKLENGSFEGQLDLLIVVNQLLTGYDSKYINTVYFDRLLEYEHLIQAISRTNRIDENNQNKPFGNIVFYHRPIFLYEKLTEALTVYAYADPKMADPKKIEVFYEEINKNFRSLQELFSDWKHPDFENVPESIDPDEAKKFIECFIKIKKSLICAEILGFSWEKNKDNEKILLNEEQWKKLNVRIEDVRIQYNNTNPSKEYNEVFSELDNLQPSVWRETIDSSYIQSLIHERNKKLTLDEFLAQAQVQNEIAKFPKVYQPFATECFREMYNDNPGIDINICVDQKRSENFDNEINKFAEEMNIDSKKLKNYINDDKPINNNNRIDRLVEGRQNEKVKENIMKVKQIPASDIKKIKKSNHKEVVLDFIKTQRAKLKQ